MSQPADHTVHANHSPLRSALQGVREQFRWAAIFRSRSRLVWSRPRPVLPLGKRPPFPLIYAGASQFLFVGMIAAGAPLWLVVAMTLLINVRHVVYGPNLAALLPSSRHWPWLMHGLTDQVFALALTRLPQLPEVKRFSWFVGASLLAWAVWIIGTVIGATGGEAVTARWPLLGEIMPFALPALFLTMVAPRFTDKRWAAAMLCTIFAALGLNLAGWSNVAIPLAAACGALCFYTVTFQPRRSRP